MKPINDPLITGRVLSSKFYKCAKDNVSIIPDSICRNVFRSPNFIPNLLRNNEEDRRIMIISVCINRSKTLEELFGFLDDDEELELHMCQMDGVLSSTINFQSFEDILNAGVSYRMRRIPLEIKCSKIAFTDFPAIIAAEIYKTPPNKFKLKVKNSPKLELIGMDYEPMDMFLSNGMSFVKKSMSNREIRERIVFLNTRCAMTMDNMFVPVDVTILDYHGVVLLDTMVTPRAKIQNSSYGVDEKKELGNMDQWECISRVHDLVRGKILIGCNLSVDIAALRIKLDNIVGLRDLANAKCLDNHKSKNGSGFKLSVLVNDMLGEILLCSTPSANQNANDIRKIYLKIENQWIDSAGSMCCDKSNNQLDLSKKSISLKRTFSESNIDSNEHFLTIEQEIGPEPTIELDDDIDQNLGDSCLLVDDEEEFMEFIVKIRKIDGKIFYPVRIIYETKDKTDEYIEEIDLSSK